MTEIFEELFGLVMLGVIIGFLIRVLV